jgi:hypothetical protein
VEVACSPAAAVYVLGKGSRAVQVVGHDLQRVPACLH